MLERQGRQLLEPDVEEEVVDDERGTVPRDAKQDVEHEMGDQAAKD